ncbi:hypothetical protein [Coleofasciculus sp. G2-EDA-02]|uniref:hypothetical protein n=1 Tax=Coleofasciculus sp. G2-EDA-02 TaxID=3069529 RepID=UPI0032F1B1E1
MELILTLITEGLSLLLEPVSRRVGKRLIGQEIIESRKLNETALQPILQKAAETVSDNTYFSEGYLKDLLDQYSDSIFGVFALLSTTLEEDKRQDPNYVPCSVYDLRENDDYYFFGGIRWVLIARFQPVPDDKVQAEMDRCGFSPEQQDFIWRWIRREINLVADTPEYEIF